MTKTTESPLDAGPLPSEIVSVAESFEGSTCILNEAGDILYTNSKWEEFGAENGGTGDGGSVGTNYFAISQAAAERGDEWATTACEKLEQVLQGATDSATYDYPCHSPDCQRWFRAHLTTFTVDGDRFVYSTHFDITEEREQRKALQNDVEVATSLTDVLIHDLQNHLHIAKASTEFLDKDVDGLQDERSFVRLTESLTRMEQTLESAIVLANPSEHETGPENTPHSEPIEFKEVLHDAWHMVETRDATLDVTSTFPLEANRDLVLNLFENLFRNALIHGTPTEQASDLTITCGGMYDSDGECYGFYVADNGIGIPEEEREKVLESGTSLHEGNGIGLDIVQNVSAAHGWTLSIRESETNGAQFEFHF